MHTHKRLPFVSFISLTFALLVLPFPLAACSLKPRDVSAFPAAVSATLPPADPSSPTPPPAKTSLPPSSTPQPSPALSPAATNTPTATASPTLTPTVSPTLTVPVAEGRLTAGGVNLREGPGYLFPVLQQFGYNTQVSILSAAPGREWLQVKTADGVAGWMSAQYIQADLPLEAISTAPPFKDWITLKGSVKDNAGQPLVGAYIQLYDANGHRAYTRSWEDSYFYFFLPLSSQGRWTLQAWRPACISAFKNNPSCPGPGYFLDNPRPIDIRMDQTVDFVYQLYGQ